MSSALPLLPVKWSAAAARCTQVAGRRERLRVAGPNFSPSSQNTIRTPLAGGGKRGKSELQGVGHGRDSSLQSRQQSDGRARHRKRPHCQSRRGAANYRSSRRSQRQPPQPDSQRSQGSVCAMQHISRKSAGRHKTGGFLSKLHHSLLRSDGRLRPGRLVERRIYLLLCMFNGLCLGEAILWMDQSNTVGGSDRL